MFVWLSKQNYFAVFPDSRLPSMFNVNVPLALLFDMWYHSFLKETLVNLLALLAGLVITPMVANSSL